MEASIHEHCEPESYSIGDITRAVVVTNRYRIIECIDGIRTKLDRCQWRYSSS